MKEENGILKEENEELKKTVGLGGRGEGEEESIKKFESEETPTTKAPSETSEITLLRSLLKIQKNRITTMSLTIKNLSSIIEQS